MIESQDQRGNRHLFRHGNSQVATSHHTSNPPDSGYVTHSATMPTSGYYRAGQVVTNTGASATTPDGSGRLLTGWTRATSGNSHVLGTDWLAMRVSTLA